MPLKWGGKEEEEGRRERVKEEGKEGKEREEREREGIGRG